MQLAQDANTFQEHLGQGSCITAVAMDTEDEIEGRDRGQFQEITS